jgi:hypothetical protein
MQINLFKQALLKSLMPSVAVSSKLSMFQRPAQLMMMSSTYNKGGNSGGYKKPYQKKSEDGSSGGYSKGGYSGSGSSYGGGSSSTGNDRLMFNNKRIYLRGYNITKDKVMLAVQPKPAVFNET